MSTISRVIFILLCAWAAEIHAAAERPVVLVFGDSLSAGYGMEPETGWVTQLARRIDAAGYRFEVVNASVSGETTDGGLARLPRALRLHRPAVVILELGANDGLRALPVASTRRNLQTMIQLSRAAKARVLVLGVRLPPNYGVRYNNDFEKMFASFAREERVAVVPWFMRDVADRPERMQPDGLHPNEEGQKPLLDNVWPVLLKLLADIQAKAA